jgi:hypothetical protein
VGIACFSRVFRSRKFLRLADEAQQVARCFSFSQRCVRQGRVEFVAEAKQQLDARQTVQTEVALKVAAEADTSGPHRVGFFNEREYHAQ